MTDARSLLWPLAIAVAALTGTSLAACIMPFIGVAVVAAATSNRAQALLAVLGAWGVNQLIGFGLMGYPTDAVTIAWGLALGVGSLAAWAAADAVLRGRLTPARLVGAFAAAFVVNQVLLYAFAMLTRGTENFSPAIEGQLLLINGVCVAGLLLLHAALTRAAPRVFVPQRA